MIRELFSTIQDRLRFGGPLILDVDHHEQPILVQPPRPTLADLKITPDVIDIIQQHLNREAGARLKLNIQPVELCAAQKAELTADLRRLLVS